MRSRYLFALLLTLTLAAVATAAFAAPSNEPGKPGDPGKSSSAPGRSQQEDAKHDPSNPDGTYQGKSPSTPDQDGIGADHGIDNNDKTGPGTDGNNGCGNDSDREDDNNGWCGRKPAPDVSPTETTPEVSPTTSPSPQAQVLGRTIVRSEIAAQGLARTGAGLVTPIAAASTLLTMGFGIRAITKKPRN